LVAQIISKLVKILSRRQEGIRPPLDPVVAARIRELRAQGLTVRQVAAALGVSTSTVHRYERLAPAGPTKPPEPAPAQGAPDLEALVTQLEKVREIYSRLAALAVEDRRPVWERALDKLAPVVLMALVAQLSA